MRLKRWQIVGILLVIAVSLSACPAAPPTPRHAYAQYLANWNDFMESYRIHYESQTPEVQAKWDENLNKPLLAVSTALGQWGENPTSYEKEQAFLTLKRTAEQLLIKYGAPKPEEVNQ